MYTYLIRWSNLQVSYYGVRFSKNSRPEDLWVTYFTSSKYVHAFIKENGNPDLIEVRKIFTESTKARIWEHKVLRRLKVIGRKDWLNRTDNKSIDPEAAYPKWTEESREKIRKSKLGKPSPNKGKKASDETRAKLSAARTGRKHSPETRAMMSIKQKERGGYSPSKHTMETRQKMSKSRIDYMEKTV